MSPAPSSPRRARRTRYGVLGGALAAVLLLPAPPAAAAPAGRSAPGPVNAAFAEAAAAYQVPRDLIVAVGYSETRLDDHGGRPSHANGYGVMHLVSNPRHRSLDLAARLTGASGAGLRRNTAANIRGAAAVLRAYADDLGLTGGERRDIAAWYPAVARYSGASDDASARFYADGVYAYLSRGIAARTPAGETVRVRPHRAALAAADPGDHAATDYPAARWIPADSANYRPGREAAITTVVIHVAEGTYDGTIDWFRDPLAEVSAHYVIRSSDGEITQMVRDADTAWHAKSANDSSLGIEHEGYVEDATWFSEALYRSSAVLTRHLCDRYGIPRDRAHIVGHSEVPGNDHTDPGPHWDWEHYLRLVDTAPGSALGRPAATLPV
uniref:N-acetylmuramoyl-L-alanine amidase n=1 Tax=Streptomyces litchfieldiae TaxID=3075543 RepID=UPI00374E1DF1